MSETETNIQWSQQIDQMLASWCDNAKCFEYMHNESYDYNSTQSRKMTMFITVLTALTGTMNIGIGNISISGFQLSWVFGGLTVLTSMATMIQDKLGYAQNSEAHKRFCNTWGQIRRRIESELILPYGSRKDCSSFLKLVRSDIDQVSSDGNTRISHIVKQQCFEKFKQISNFDIPDICGQMEHTRVYVNHELESHIVSGSIEHDLQKPLVINEVKT